jgi:hypothetical protein
MTFAPDVGVAAEEDGNSMLGSRRKETDILGRPLENRAIHANVMAAPDIQLPPPVQLSTADSVVVIEGPSREPTVARTGDRPSHFQYDVV